MKKKSNELDLKLATDSFDTENKLVKVYTDWKKNKLAIGKYAIIPNSIKDYLKYISTPALNLYLFYVVSANNETGISYYSVEKLASELNVSKKTIDNWNSLLINLGLIVRDQRYNSSSITYLLPISDSVFLIDKKSEFAFYKEYFEDENFNLKYSFNILELDNKNEKTLYEINFYSKKFTHTYSGSIKKEPVNIVRNHFLVYKKMISKDQRNFSKFENNFDWILIDEKLNILLKKDLLSKDEKNMLGNLEILLFQLDTDIKVEAFKEKYNQLDNL